jgi:electron transport complex protein RnfA
MDFLFNILIIAVSGVLINNFVLMQFLGLCPCLGVSKRLDSAMGMGMAIIFVMTIASALTWVIYTVLLVPFDITYLRTIAFILAIASIVQFIEMVIQKRVPSLYKSLGVFLPLITTNCAVLGVAILNVNESRTFIDSVLYGFFGGVGFLLVLVLLAGLRERLEKADVPKPLKGMPIALITVGCMALAFFGFSGMRIGG